MSKFVWECNVSLQGRQKEGCMARHGSVGCQGIAREVRLSRLKLMNENGSMTITDVKIKSRKLTSILGRSHRFSLSCSPSVEVFSEHDTLTAREHSKTATKVFIFCFLSERIFTTLSGKTGDFPTE